ncbi:MAG: putative Ig domain-containing protein [Raineya sp.]|jgi:hypothetical protein|nr:putative Ig domain-containing protein [Raineya sp.]
MTKILTYSLILMLALFNIQRVSAQARPDVLHYTFNETGTSVSNLASSPPTGTATATIQGGVTQGNTGTCGGALVGSGVSSTSDYLNTGWALDLGTSSWTIAWWSEGISNNTTLYYIFGDVNTNSFRCFTNGVAGANNWILRGAGLTDTYINGGALSTPTFNAFVYDNTTNQVKAYLNGVLVSTVAQGTPNVTGTGPLKVMGYDNRVGAPAGGKLDEFRVYRRALSDAEIAALLAGSGGSLSPATGSLPDGTVGSTYSQTITQTGLTGTPTWSVSSGSLPAGLSLNASTGEISGTPSVSGTSNFTIQATSGACSNTQAYSIKVCPVITITPNTLPMARETLAYSQMLTQTGLTGVVTWSITSGSLPIGLSLNASTGMISGTPTTLQTANFTVQATDGVCSATKAYSIVVEANGAIIEVNITDIDFSDVLILQSSRKTITVKNIGVAPLSLSSMSMPNVVFNYGFIGTTPILPNESREFEVSFTPIAVASYTGTVTVNSNAVAGVNTFTVRGNGVNPTALNANKEAILKAYPNPTTDQVNISVENAWIGEYHVSVKNLLGKEVMSQKTNSSVFQVDLTNMPSGLYLIQVSHKNGSRTIQIAKK